MWKNPSSKWSMVAESLDLFTFTRLTAQEIFLTVIDYKLTVLVGNCTSTMCIQLTVLVGNCTSTMCIQSTGRLIEIEYA